MSSAIDMSPLLRGETKESIDLVSLLVFFNRGALPYFIDSLPLSGSLLFMDFRDRTPLGCITGFPEHEHHLLIITVKLACLKPTRPSKSGTVLRIRTYATARN